MSECSRQDRPRRGSEGDGRPIVAPRALPTLAGRSAGFLADALAIGVDHGRHRPRVDPPTSRASMAPPNTADGSRRAPRTMGNGRPSSEDLLALAGLAGPIAGELQDALTKYAVGGHAQELVHRPLDDRGAEERDKSDVLLGGVRWVLVEHLVPKAWPPASGRRSPRPRWSGTPPLWEGFALRPSYPTREASKGPARISSRPRLGRAHQDLAENRRWRGLRRSQTHRNRHANAATTARQSCSWRSLVLHRDRPVDARRVGDPGSIGHERRRHGP